MTYDDYATAPVLALHGSASTSRQWRDLSTYLEDRFHVITPDLPGYGMASRVKSGADLMADAMPVIQEIEHLGNPVHLVGHSFGAAVAMKIGSVRPDLVVSLTVYEPVLFGLLKDGSTRNQKLYGEIQEVAGGLSEALEWRVPDKCMAGFIDYWNGAGTWYQLPILAQEKFEAQTEIVAENFRHLFDDSIALDDLAKINVPTMLMVGLDSPEVTQQIGSMVTHAIPNAKLALIPGLGHMAPVDAAEWVNPRIFHHILEVEQYRVTGAEALRWVA
jgi:pimeloyl-ACP methyl ester carboxylesterase